MKKRALLTILLINIVSFLIILRVHQAVATVTAVLPADVYTITVSTRYSVVDTHTIDINMPPTITLLPNCGTGPDVQFTVQGFNWPPNQTIGLYWDNALQSTINTGSQTSFSQTWQKLGITDGSYVVKAVAGNGLEATAVFTIPCPSLPGGVTISGPATGFTGTSTAFTASVSPLSTTQPLTYTWQASGQPTIIQTGGITNTIVYTWPSPGHKPSRSRLKMGSAGR